MSAAVRARVHGGSASRSFVRLRVADGGDGAADSRVAEIQRSRLLAGAVSAVEELGYSRVTVAHITRRARVSRRTFYELFANREECLAAVLDDVVESVRGELAGARLEGLVWRERVRAGLWVILSFFDREPALARMCVVQSLSGGQAVLERREAILGELAGVLDEGRLASARGRGVPPLTAPGLVGAACSIVYGWLLRGERRPLSGLLGELMGMIMLPYLGPAAARREQQRPVPEPQRGGLSVPAARGSARVERDPLEGVPMRLTYRTARVLECVAEHPGVSNRGVADSAGIQDQGQVSKLLARLERLGLLQNSGGGHGKGEPNAWTLTPTGMRVARNIKVHSHGRAA